MEVEMTDMDVLWSFYEAIGCVGNLSGLQKRPSQPEHYKASGRWRTAKRQLIHDLVLKFYPYMHERRRAKCDEFLTWYYKK